MCSICKFMNILQPMGYSTHWCHVRTEHRHNNNVLPNSHFTCTTLTYTVLYSPKQYVFYCSFGYYTP